ncbi:MAG TPA: hypothetical protein VLU95_08120 [Candidatus Acidoferrum sp.]|nr:hypothetical protein [Candidatus Acidoferrum sp.]
MGQKKPQKNAEERRNTLRVAGDRNLQTQLTPIQKSKLTQTEQILPKTWYHPI